MNTNAEHPSKMRIRCRWLRRGAVCKRYDASDKMKNQPMASSAN